MSDAISQAVGQSMSNFQSALNQGGETLESFLQQHYIKKWNSDAIYHVMAIRTTFVNAMHEYLAGQGLLNMERISISPVTDPLAHDIEHLPMIGYKGHTYVTTHSMIYAKFLACFNKKMRGIYVDSPNIRLELESATGDQRKKYLIDFSQMDVEVRRNRGLTLDDYFNDIKGVKKILADDFEKALSFFEGLIVHAMSRTAEINEDNLKALHIRLEVPSQPFPRFACDEAIRRVGKTGMEKKLGLEVRSQFFWVTGILRENYDLVYPYLMADGTKAALAGTPSSNIWNYDLCAQSIHRDSGRRGDAYEVLSGAIREWLYGPIIERLIDNKIIDVRPVFSNGNIENISELGSYGPFLAAASQNSSDGSPMFPETFGGGIGIERVLFALCANDIITKVDDVTLFGKNPDSHPLYLF